MSRLFNRKFRLKNRKLTTKIFLRIKNQATNKKIQIKLLLNSLYFHQTVIFNETRKILGLKVSQLSLEEQFRLIKPFRIFPLHLRLFIHYCLFLNKLIRNGKAVYLLSKITKLEGRDQRNP